MTGKALYCASVWAHIYNFHMPYIRELENTGWEVHVAAAGIPAGAPLAHDLPVKKSVFSLKNISAVFRLAGLMRRENFRLICVHTTLAAFLCRAALVLSRVRGVRLVYVCHGYFFTLNKRGRIKKNPSSVFYLLCEKLLAGQTSTLVLMNAEDYAAARKYRLCADVRLSRGMGLVPERYTLPEQKPDGGPVVFLSVGEFSARKNQAQTVRAFAGARKSMPLSALWFAGDGSGRGRCERLAKSLGIVEHVKFLGHVENVSEIYAVADVLVSSSLSEGLPFCVMEGLYFGLPVIASDIKGHRDLIRHGVNGLLYDLKAEPELAGHMARLGRSGAERRRFSGMSALPEEYFIKAAMDGFISVIYG